MVLVGLGGNLAEVIDRFRMYPAPFGPATATGLLDELGAGRILRSAGGGATLHAAARLLASVSQLAGAGRGLIREMDLNPVVVDYQTGRALVVDALAVTAAGESRAG
jgi:hypothetical protein